MRAPGMSQWSGSILLWAAYSRLCEPRSAGLRIVWGEGLFVFPLMLLYAPGGKADRGRRRCREGWRIPSRLRLRFDYPAGKMMS